MYTTVYWFDNETWKLVFYRFYLNAFWTSESFLILLFITVSTWSQMSKSISLIVLLQTSIEKLVKMFSQILSKNHFALHLRETRYIQVIDLTVNDAVGFLYPPHLMPSGCSCFGREFYSQKQSIVHKSCPCRKTEETRHNILANLHYNLHNLSLSSSIQ